MPVIHLETHIKAPVDVCFDLSRSVNMHRDPPVAGVVSGLMVLGDIVTWESVHFGVKQSITSKIAEMERPRRFVDELIRGNFKSLRHVHTFVPQGEGTLMIDDFEFHSRGGGLARFLDATLLRQYMRKILQGRNRHIIEVAESGHWEPFLQEERKVAGMEASLKE